MVRKIIRIDEDRCNGCGACAAACREGAIEMVNGKAKLVRVDYCDGLGACLPACPTAAITFEEQEAPPFDAAAVAHAAQDHPLEQTPSDGCPGSRAERLNQAECAEENLSQLRQWPVQIKLAPTKAPYFQAADLLIAADCAAYAYGSFHQDFMRRRVTLIGCPKLDGCDYSEKLTEILRHNDIRSVTVVRMEVPCCGGIERAVKTALLNSGKRILCNVVTISTDGRMLR